MRPENLLADTHLKSAIRVYLYYRLALSAILTAMFFSGLTQNVLGTKLPDLFLYASLSYFAICAASLLFFPPSSLEHSRKRISFLLLIDIGAQIVLIHASGGTDSGLSYMMIVTAAMTSIFIRGQLAYAFAALISILMLADTYYLEQQDRAKEMFSAGILGILIFATTMVLQFLSEKVRKSSSDAREQSLHLKNLQQIAQNIVARMQTGVIVVDSSNQLELINESASDMLGLSTEENYFGRYAKELPQLRDLDKLLLSQDDVSKPALIRSQRGTEIRVSVATLNSGDLPKSICYLEDYSSVTQHAQQIKLASLGRLAASIAHEIRNPLGAVSHAAQLLLESDELSGGDERMTQIILSNCKRVNDIVENTLALSRRKEPEFEQIELASWLRDYIRTSHSANQNDIEITILNEPLLVRVDPTHLRQILSNLIVNGLHHSRASGNPLWLEIEAGTAKSGQRPFIAIKDNGKGVPADKINHIFEPFFTTEDKGSGLGLYISRELAEINHATLSYKRTRNELSCFRLDFQHHQRIR